MVFTFEMIIHIIFLNNVSKILGTYSDVRITLFNASSFEILKNNVTYKKKKF